MAAVDSFHSRATAPLAVLAAVGWAWAVALLSVREHLTTYYAVTSAAPPLWGCLALNGIGLLTLTGAGIGLGILCHRDARRTGQAIPIPTRWLLSAWVVPLVDLLRLTGSPIRLTFVEPILITAVTGAAVRHLARNSWLGFAEFSESPMSESRVGRGRIRNASRGGFFDGLVGRAVLPRFRSTVWIAAVWVLTFVSAGWWYWQSHQTYDDYLLGYNDFGHFAWRVANTWEGRGFLMETPGLSAFWDHFNPGLALLAPLWGLWPDAGLFFAIQAICLALPAPLVYAIARRLDASPGAGAAWAAAYLLYPGVEQLNLNCTYGWHPVSLALPLMFVAMAAILSGRRIAAGAACLLACSFQEDIVAVLGLLCVMMSLEAWRHRNRDLTTERNAAPLACRLPWWGWLAAGAVFLVAFATIFELAAFSRYQVGRFSRLGGTFGEVSLSPVLRPRVFWATVLRPQAAYFLLALLVPLGLFHLRELRRGWFVFAATLVPLAVLVAWGHVPATSIAFQYATPLIPLFFLSAMIGASAGAATVPDCTRPAASQRDGTLASAGIAAMAAGAVASIWYGAMPWSSPTLTDVINYTYQRADGRIVLADRESGSPGNALLNSIVERAGRPQASVLATGRIAAHLLHVRRLDTIAQAGDRWKQFEAEARPGRSPIELFDFVILDTAESLYQSPRQCQFIIEQARQAGYRLIVNKRDILVYAHPSAPPLTGIP